MIGLVVVSHADLAVGLLNAARLIVGPQERTKALGLAREESPEQLQTLLRQAVAEAGADGDGVIIMTDMFGGTPNNISIELLTAGGCEILSGVNLPMLLKFFNSRAAMELSPLARLLRDYGRQGVTLVSELLGPD